MTEDRIHKIDALFKSYNYILADNSNNKVRVYTLRYGMYHAAEIISFDEEYDVSKYKHEYSELGYATDVKILNSEESIEEYLFNGFFIKTPLGNELRNRYKHFVNRQLHNLPENSQYKYIESSFDLIFQNEHGNVIENTSYNGSTDITLIDKINNYLSDVSGALFVIIEAPAGFGKTCTANEILNTFSVQDCKKLPFFTELSRNREARVFKHILLNEIDEQFPNGIKQNIVLEQIFKGRIPLIIDGFDELISKESNKDEVESMLTTIIDLLKGQAKIIITSRKTAIFNSDEFLNAIFESQNEFSLARFEIKEPTIENWLDNNKIELIENSSFPLEQIANPVLLSYLRNISIEKLSEYVLNSDGALINKYFDYLLKREQVRQNLKLSNESQLRIFRKLNRFMSEFNITAESKDTIKDFIKEYNLKILQDSLRDYIAEERPTIEDLVDTLSNHVFLDRKNNGNVGFVNDYIFGNFIGENLIYKKFQEHYKNFTEVIPQDFALKSIESFKIQNHDNKILLWEIYNENDFKFDMNFYFELDYNLIKKFSRCYTNLFLIDKTIRNINFDSSSNFIECNFSSVNFENCKFNTSIFEKTSFQNCGFYSCEITNSDKIEFINFAIYACNTNNSFLEEIENRLLIEDGKKANKKLTEEDVLKHFFQVDGIKPRARKFSYIKKILTDYTDREVSKIIDNLKKKEYLHFKDDVGFITREAINHLIHIKE
ncbi:NACHT domain-containing protein [Flavobacterium sp. CFBP9031]|uniref:NACHT domain-containing protein n=1 Tax=Flavobacterium sp. CFBP9031 TaxID=3096538 RepID=UPI002A6B8BE0|nr:NACHT domain-containing protein [Flavobacterium sp. CFBP9031]MDY0989152.1 NACHT domain-containing protein [Flavobacterium sp. CFBP9031]